MNLALFDFDGTITRKDSFADFLTYTFGAKYYYQAIARNSLMLTRYKLGLIDNSFAKSELFRFFFKGWEYSKFVHAASNYSKNRLSHIVKPSAHRCIEQHKHNGDSIIVVSASIKEWLIDWTNRNGLHLISTEIEVVGEQLTGSFATLNCHGEEKVRRITRHCQDKKFNRIFAYGDTKGDKPMLALANFPFYRRLPSQPELSRLLVTASEFGDSTG